MEAVMEVEARRISRALTPPAASMARMLATAMDLVRVVSVDIEEGIRRAEKADLDEAARPARTPLAVALASTRATLERHTTHARIPTPIQTCRLESGPVHITVILVKASQIKALEWPPEILTRRAAEA